VNILDWLNPWTWRADRRGARDLKLTEDRDARERSSSLGARYLDEPRVSQPSVSRVGGTIEDPTFHTHLGSKTRHHHMQIQSGGPASAEDVWVWLAYADGEVRRTEKQHLGLLAVGAEREVRFVESEFAGGFVPREGSLMCSWHDGNGEHIKALLAVTVFI
jgi:hypothetical protein